MRNKLKKIYGSYEIPQEILELLKLEESLQKISLSLDFIGLRPITEEYSYSITPVDLIPFANTGGDGIHFGFLTEFSQVKDLNGAPIVCVTPTNDPPIRYIARNLKEFFELATSVPNVELLETFWAYETNQQIEDAISEFQREGEDSWNKDRQLVYEYFQQTFGTNQKDIILYFKEILEERRQRITMNTFDGLGVIGENIGGTDRNLHLKHPLTENDLKDISEFLTKANRTEKLAFIRDAIYSFIVSPSNDKEIYKLLLKQLKDLNLSDEMKRLKMRD